ncbi:hypothetical protein BO71DRAFT_397031 [Aspergillus ellipticus CBS 707.79]|uniref:Rhodopsin domain-containing protein n=1 Tax=Aspergillus ellipticus CBS 707.79 TaxID=1448320 RepID=A0A319DGT6_9EURO|nr:hypothetical protein BO71DRAFT_397031 [Aspergillus ellipticus CBS 707.79]
MGLDIPAGTPDRGPGVRALFIVLLVCTTLMTLTRIVSKIVTKQRWWWDDLFALLSWPAEVIILSTLIAWVSLGLGLHEEFVEAQDPSLLIRGAKYFYVCIFFFDASICLPKLSALFLYARVFNNKNPALRIQLWILGTLTVCWLISAVLVTVWQCSPIPKAWNPTIPGTCVNTFAWYTATATLSCAMDIWILIIPVPLIWGLNSSLRRRIYLLVAFVLTYSVIVVSIGRMIATVQIIPKVAEDETWNLTTYLYWATLEGSLSIISISVPNAIALAKHPWGRNKNSNHNSNSNSSKLTYELNQTQNYASIRAGRTSLSGNSDKQVLVAGAATDAEMALGNIRVMTNIRVH